MILALNNLYKIRVYYNIIKISILAKLSLEFWYNSTEHNIIIISIINNYFQQLVDKIILL